MRWRAGSNEAPDQLPPPSELGNTRLGTMPYGVYGPDCTIVSYSALHAFSDSGDILFTSSRVMLIREMGGGLSGNGWGGQAASPSASSCGTRRSSAPKIRS